jgi:hypothetical protein
VSQWLTSHDIFIRKIVTKFQKLTKSFNKILHTSRRLVSFTMMFSKETLSLFTNQYIAARKGNSCVPVFASSAALPETLKEPIVLFLQQYYLSYGDERLKDGDV